MKMNSRFKYICFISKCQKHYYYICTLKKHLISAHKPYFQTLVNSYPGKNFYEVFRLIKENNMEIRSKFDFIDFKSGDPASEKDSKEYAKEKRNRFKCTLSRKSYLERNAVGIAKKAIEDVNNMKRNNQGDCQDGVSHNRICGKNSAQINEKENIPSEGKSVINQENSNYKLNKFNGDFCDLNSMNRNVNNMNPSSFQNFLNNQNLIHVNNYNTKNNFSDFYQNLCLNYNNLLKLMAANMITGRFPLNGNELTDPYKYLNQAMPNTTTHIPSFYSLDMLRRLSQMNSDMNISTFSTDNSANSCNIQGNSDYLTILNNLVVNNLINKTNISHNNNSVIDVLSSLAQQAGSL